MSLNKLRKLRKKSHLRKSENNSKLKVLSLFSGAGGAEMGFDDRFKVVGFSEINKDCVNVLDLHWPGVKNYGDITKLEPRKLPDHDLLIGGSPCQSFSLAGRRKGLEGESGLFFNFVEVLKAKKPTYFIWENVKGTFSSEDGWDFAVIQTELAEAGYVFRYHLVNATKTGIPQSRDRIFIVGTLRGRSGREVFFEPRDSGENNNDSRVQGEACYQDTKEKQIGKDYSYCIDSNYYKGANANHKNRRQLVGELQPHFVGGINKGRDRIGDGKTFARNFPDGDRVWDAEKGPVPTLSSNSGNTAGRGNHLIAYSKSTREHHIDHRGRIDESANTLNTGEGCRSQSTENLVFNEEDGKLRIRRLTPLECERIMGWPDNHTKYGLLAGRKYKISDSRRYQMCGNGIVSRCVTLMIYNLLGVNDGK